MPMTTRNTHVVRYCTSRDGVRIAFEQQGAGPTILKAAHWMSHLDEDRDSPLWRHWIDLLTDGRRLVRFDGRGHGLSEREPADLSFESMLADMEAVVDAARLERFPILGFCHGGPLAIAYANRHPERVSALVLCGTYAQGRAIRDTSPRDEAERELLLRLIEVGWGQDSDAYRQVFAMRAIPRADADALSSFCSIQRASSTPEQAKRLTRLFWDIDVTRQLASLRCPTLVVHARGDDLVPFAQGQLLAQRIAGARLVALNSANHDLLADEPAWPILCSAVRDFLAHYSGGAVARDRRDLASLTRREREVLESMARGLDNEEIATALAMSEKTVRNHVTAIFSKLEFSSRGRAIVWARDAGLGRDPA